MFATQNNPIALVGLSADRPQASGIKGIGATYFAVDTNTSHVLTSQNGTKQWQLASGGAGVSFTLYVDPVNGSDSNSGRTPATSVRTLTAALSLRPAYWSGAPGIIQILGSGVTVTEQTLVLDGGLPSGPAAAPTLILGSLIPNTQLGQMVINTWTPDSAGWGGTINVTNSLTADQVAGAFVIFDDGPAQGHALMAMNNDASGNIRIGRSIPGPATGNRFHIYTPGVTISHQGLIHDLGIVGCWGVTFQGSVVNINPAAQLILDSCGMDMAGGGNIRIVGGTIIAASLSTYLNSWITIAGPGPIPAGVGSKLLDSTGAYIFNGNEASLLCTLGSKIIGTFCMRNAGIHMNQSDAQIAFDIVGAVAGKSCNIDVNSGTLHVTDYGRMDGVSNLSNAFDTNDYGGGYMNLNNVFIKNYVNGIGAGDGVRIFMNNVTSPAAGAAGHNTGVGVVAMGPGASVQAVNSTVTGAGGDVTVGSNGVTTWANINGGQAQFCTDFNASSGGVATSKMCRVGP